MSNLKVHSNSTPRPFLPRGNGFLLSYIILRICRVVAPESTKQPSRLDYN